MSQTEVGSDLVDTIAAVRDAAARADAALHRKNAAYQRFVDADQALSEANAGLAVAQQRMFDAITPKLPEAS